MADKFHSDTQEKVESIIYQPGLKDSGDLEAGTKTITVTSKPGTADYTTNLTIPAPSDSRLTVTKLALRGNIHIDSFGGSPAATKLYCTVECNGVEKVSAKELTSAGADNFLAADMTANFNLGTANELKVYLWVNQGNAVVSVCQLWLAVGTCGTGRTVLLKVTFTGTFTFLWRFTRVGTGSSITGLTQGADYGGCTYWTGNPPGGAGDDCQMPMAISSTDIRLFGLGTVATDINYLERAVITLRSLQ